VGGADLLVDEPTAELDEANRALALLRAAAAQGAAGVVAANDPAVVACCDRMLRPADTVQVWPANSRVVAEDAYRPLPFQHRIEEATVEERDGGDVGQPWVRLDVEVGLSGQRRNGQDLVELGQPALGLGRQPGGRLSEFWLCSIR
jgi:hypothetical protein